MDDSQQQPDTGPLDEILAEYLQAVESGRAPDRQALVDCHPEYTAELREFFADRDEFERAVRPLVVDKSGSVEGRAAATRGGEFSPPPAFGLVRYFGDYELLSELGRGGMGVVYKARQVSLNRPVAVKMVLAGQFAGPGEVKRFQVEAENAAGLDHPNIVPIHEVGRHHGQHYYSMKLIEGGSLAAQIPRFVGDPRAAATLIATTARAVHYAHERGILHRDIKPSNILIDSQGEPQVTDFGLARRLGQDSDLTLSGAVMGSPRYMSPEQARGEKVLSVAVDVYSLGAVFYELLTATPAFMADTAIETLRLVREQEPARPSALVPRLDRDLETICLKCLEKEPAKRYASALALAEDLERWLAGELISARPATLWQRTAKWAKRRPALATLTVVSVIATLLIVAISVGVPYGVRLRHALKDTQQARKEEQEALNRSEAFAYLTNIALAEREVTAGNIMKAEELLDACPTDKRAFEWHYLKQLCHRELSSMEIDKSGIVGLSLSAKQQRMAVVCASGLLKVLDPTTFQVVFELRDQGISCATFSPDGLVLAIARKDRQIKLLDAMTGNELRGREVQSINVTALAFSPDATILAVGDRSGRLVFLDLDLLEKAIPIQETRPPFFGSDGVGKTGEQVNSLVFSPDGRSLLSACGKPGHVSSDSVQHPILRREAPGVVQLWDVPAANALASAQLLPAIEPGLTLTPRNTAIVALAISPDGKRVAAGSADRSIRIWSIHGGAPVATFNGHTDTVTAVLFDPERDRLYSAGDNSVRAWDFATGKERFTHYGHGAISALAYDPVKKLLFSGDAEGRLKVWDSQDSPSRPGTFTSGEPANDVALSRDGGRLAIVAENDKGRKLTVWRLADNTRVFEAHGIRAGREGRVLFNADETLLAVNDARSVVLYSANSGAIVGRLNLSRPGNVDPHIYGLAFSPDGRRIAAASAEDGIDGDQAGQGQWTIWDVASGEERVRVPLTTAAWDIAFSGDGRHVAVGRGSHQYGVGTNAMYGGIPGQVELYDAHTGKQVRSFSGSRYCVWGIALSPDGTRIASASGFYGGADQGEVKVWDTATGNELFTFTCPHCPVRVTFSYDNSRLAATGVHWNNLDMAPLVLWDLRTGREVFRLPLPSRSSWGIALDRSGTRLAAATGDGVRVWGPGIRPMPATQPSVPTTQRAQ
jgi:WD40 repeat protein